MADAPLVPADPAAVVAKLQEGDELDVRDLCLKHTKRSVSTLVDCQRRTPKTFTRTVDGEKIKYTDDAPSHSVRRQAARDVLDLAHGKPDVRSTEIAPGGFIVVIQEFTGGKSDVEVAFEAVPQPDHGADGEVVDADYTALEAGDITVESADWRDELRAELAQDAEEG